MSMIALLVAELRHRKLHVALSLSALVVAATLVVAGPTLLDGYRQESQAALNTMQERTAADLVAMHAETDLQLGELQSKADQDLAELEKRTRRIMRDLGFNLRIVHQNTDLTRLYAEFAAFDMPEEYVARLAASPAVTKIVHLVATLRQMIQWQGKDRLIVGFAPEATQSHVDQKAPMGYEIQPGTVYLGQIAADGSVVGDQIEILGKSFQIARVLPLHGNEEDIAICMHLRDAQTLLEKEGRISEILALGCKCKTLDRIEEVTAQLELVLPETKVTEMRLQAIAREEQRKLVEKYYAQAMAELSRNREEIVDRERLRQGEMLQREGVHRRHMIGLLRGATQFVVPLIVLACTLWVGLLAWSNVRERRSEIGLLRALGKQSLSIGFLFLGRPVLLGFLGGVTGSLLGFALARGLGASVLDLRVAHFTPSWIATAGAILGTPLVAAIASYLPTLAAVRQDPASILVD